jgi:MSHA biogenesis protein MshL
VPAFRFGALTNDGMMAKCVRRGSTAVPIIAIVACASTASSRPERSPVPLEPTMAPSMPPAVSVPPVPSLSASKPAMSPATERRIRLLDVAPGTPISTAVTQLASLLGMGVTVDPEVRGTTGGTLHNVTLDRALQELVGRRGYAFQIDGSMLRVDPIRMATRTFRLDYVALSRIGTMSIVIHRQLANRLSGVKPAATNPPSADDDVFTTQSFGDVWQEIRIVLAGLLQSGQGAPPPGATPVDSAAKSVAGGTLASSTTFANGSTLVVSPMSGLIIVTAMPDKLLDVATFIDEFRAAVLRQVTIEAKIVEVDLSKTFQFGIDWNAVSTAGNSGFSLRSDTTMLTTGNAGNVHFALTGGSARIDAVLSALAEQGTVSVLSNGKTTALNNQRAVFNVTTDEVFFAVTRGPLPGGGVNQVVPQQISVGVVLDVLPQISADNILTMSIRPAVTSITRIESVTLADGTTATAPVVARREGDTIGRVRAGETMVIGGLLQNRQDSTVGGVRFLRDVPLIGKPFRRTKRTERRSELVIFLTPTVASGAPETTGAGGR